METVTTIPCTVEILTRNSGQTLVPLLASLRDFAEIIVLDGGSTDDTKAVAARFGCTVIDQPPAFLEDGRIVDFAAVRNVGLAAAHQPWFLFVDSDEIVPPEFIQDIRERVNDSANPVSLYEVNRLYIIDGVLIEHSITYPAIQTRLFRRDAVAGFIKPVHERIQARPEAQIGRLTHALHVPQENAFFPKKWFHYLGIESKKYRSFSISKCLGITARRLAQTGLYLLRYMRIVSLGKRPRAPWKCEASYIVYNVVHVFFMWKARLSP